MLDVGCGTGFFTDWYLKRGAEVYGVDIAEVSIENLSKKFNNARFNVIDITSEHYNPQMEFDIINMWDVIYHIVDDSSFRQTLKNVGNSCKKGALFLFDDFFGASYDEEGAASHVKHRCLNTYQKILPNLGFELIKIFPLFNFLNKFYKKLGILNDYLAPIFFILDLRIKNIPGDNLSLSI